MFVFQILFIKLHIALHIGIFGRFLVILGIVLLYALSGKHLIV